MKKKRPRKKELTVSEFAALGGNARAASLTEARRREIGQLGAKKRWAEKASSTKKPQDES
jgi:hypothetical protein